MNKCLAHYFSVAPENLSTQLTGLVFTNGKYSKFDAIMSYFNFRFSPVAAINLIILPSSLPPHAASGKVCGSILVLSIQQSEKVLRREKLGYLTTATIFYGNF
jgi:hypothetical protein